MAVMMNWTMRKSVTLMNLLIWRSTLVDWLRNRGCEKGWMAFLSQSNSRIFFLSAYIEYDWFNRNSQWNWVLLHFFPFKYLKETVLPGISKNISNNITRGIFMLLRNMVFHGSIKSTRTTHVFGFNDQYESLCPKRFEQWCLFWHFLQ